MLRTPAILILLSEQQPAKATAPKARLSHRRPQTYQPINRSTRTNPNQSSLPDQVGESVDQASLLKIQSSNYDTMCKKFNYNWGCGCVNVHWTECKSVRPGCSGPDGTYDTRCLRTTPDNPFNDERCCTQMCCMKALRAAFEDWAITVKNVLNDTQQPVRATGQPSRDCAAYASRARSIFNFHTNRCRRGQLPSSAQLRAQALTAKRLAKEEMEKIHWEFFW